MAKIKIVAVDNRAVMLNELTEKLLEAFPGCSVKPFTDPLLSVKYIYNYPVDIVFLEAQMRPADGIALLKVIRSQNAELPVVLLSDTDQRRLEAAEATADGFLVRPVTVNGLLSLAELAAPAFEFHLRLEGFSSAN